MTKPFDKEVLRARLQVGRRITGLERSLAQKARELARSNDAKEELIAKLREQYRLIEERTEELRRTQKKLLETAHRAGMAEIATSVLHNVGNVLNTAVTSSAVLNETLADSRLTTLERVIGIVREQADNFADYVRDDPKGQRLPEFLIHLHAAIQEEHTILHDKVRSLRDSHEHIREIIALQQSYAGIAGVREVLTVTDLLHDATQLFGESFRRHDIELALDIPPDTPRVSVEKHKVLQILMNLLNNARDALKCVDREDRRIVVNCHRASAPPCTGAWSVGCC